MKLTTEQKWQRTIRWLKRNFPAPEGYPVFVCTVQMKDNGETEFVNYLGIFNMHIRRSTFTTKIDTLLHEWAHILTWFGAETEIEDHSGEFGEAWAKIYRTFLEWDYGKAEKKRADGPLSGQREFDF